MSRCRPPIGSPDVRRPGWSTLAVVLFPLLLCPSCADPCGNEREETGRVLDLARETRADGYAAEVFTRARTLAERADAECRGQKSRPFLSRSYGKARELHGQARAEAEKAAREATFNQGVARQEALNSRHRAGQAVDTARTAIDRARRVRGSRAVEDLLDSLGRLQQALAEVQSRIDRGDFLGARDLGERVGTESVRLEAAVNNRTLGTAPR